MKCEEARTLIYEYAAGELAGEVEKAVAKHIEGCPECREECEACIELLKSMDGLDEEPAPESLLPNVMGKISAEKRRRRFNSIIRFGTAAAAAVVLVVGAVNVLPGLEKEQPAVDTERPQTTDIEQEDITYADDETVMERMFDGGATEDEIGYILDLEKDEPTNKKSESNVKNAASDNASESIPERAAEKAFESTSESSDDSADAGIMTLSLFPEEDSDDSDIYGRSDKQGRSGAGGGASGRQPVAPGITAGVAADTDEVTETYERSFICRRCEFTVTEEYSEAALSVSSANKTMSQVSAELDELGVEYEIYVIEDDYTQEYSAASAQRKAEIESMCASDQCTIVIK